MPEMSSLDDLDDAHHTMGRAITTMERDLGVLHEQLAQARTDAKQWRSIALVLADRLRELAAIEPVPAIAEDVEHALKLLTGARAR